MTSGSSGYETGYTHIKSTPRFNDPLPKCQCFCGAVFNHHLMRIYRKENMPNNIHMHKHVLVKLRPLENVLIERTAVLGTYIEPLVATAMKK